MLLVEALQCSPRYVSPRPSARFLAYVSLRSVSDFSSSVCRMVEVTSPLQLPTVIKPQARAAAPTTYTQHRQDKAVSLFTPIDVYCRQHMDAMLDLTRCA